MELNKKREKMDWDKLNKDMKKVFSDYEKSQEEFKKKQEEENKRFQEQEKLNQIERIEKLRAFNNQFEEREEENKHLKSLHLNFD